MTEVLSDQPVVVKRARIRSRLLGPLPPFWASVRFAVAAAILAVALSFFVPNRYTATGEFYLDTRPLDLGGAAGGDIASIASAVGLTTPLGGSVSPYLVVELATSDTVLAAIMRTPLPAAAFRQMQPVRSLEEHYDIDDDQPDKRFWRTVRELRDRVSTDVGNRSGLISISVWDADPGLAAWLTKLELERVQHYLAVARESRARAERAFVEGRERALRDSLAAAETALSSFLSTNRVTEQSPLLQIREAALRRKVDITTALYSGVQRDLERARADEVRDTPVMTLTSTPYPPIKKSWPKRSLIAAIAFVLAFGVHVTRAQWLPTLRSLRTAPDEPPRR
jgi:uncharacterized protein involved in exopolysaccharide biosynthesis